MLERERAVARAALWLSVGAWLVWLAAHGPEQTPPPTLRVCRPACDDALGLLFAEPLDLNRASADSLEVLPGIGPARAAAIVAERARRPFERVEDLRAIHGIGPRTISGLEGWVRVAPPRPDG